MKNQMSLKFPSKTVNEAFARSAVGAFVSQLDMSIEELFDIKTAVSEAVTNAIIHGYSQKKGEVEIYCEISEIKNKRKVFVSIKDSGVGIEDVTKAMQPLYTTMSEEERSGMGFTVMQSFMNEVEVLSKKGEGTEVNMTKLVGENNTYAEN